MHNLRVYVLLATNDLARYICACVLNTTLSVYNGRFITNSEGVV